MKIIFLNCFTGQLEKPLLDYISSASSSTDIFCFQEVSVSLEKKISGILINYSKIFEIGFMLSDCNEEAGQIIYTKNGIEIEKSEKILIHELITKDIGFLLYAELKIGNKKIVIGNVHGTSAPGDKKDTSKRLEQSKLILNSFKNLKENVIIGGDFNLLRNTKSIEMFELAGYRNLVKDFNIKATRNKIAWERFKNEPNFVKQFDSDYIFASKDVKINSLEVPYNEISDHLPLAVEIDI